MSNQERTKKLADLFQELADLFRTEAETGHEQGTGKVWTSKDLAAFLKVSVDTLGRYANNGKVLRGYRITRMSHGTYLAEPVQALTAPTPEPTYARRERVLKLHL